MIHNGCNAYARVRLNENEKEKKKEKPHQELCIGPEHQDMRCTKDGCYGV
jgi:hypothetical protein